MHPDILTQGPYLDELGRVRKVASTSRIFSDRNVIQLVTDDLMVYVDEANTELLTENFDIEVFEILTGALSPTCKTCKNETNFLENIFKKILTV